MKQNTIVKPLCLMFGLLYWVPLTAQVKSLGGVISGTVSTEKGSLVPAAIVHLIQVTTGPQQPLLKPQSVVSGKEGGFFFSSLTPGKYRVCVKLASSTLLDPCDWETKQVLYALNTGQFLGGLKLVMKQGALLPIRLDDPGNTIIANESKANGSHVLIGVSMANGMFMPASQLSDSKTAAGREFQVLIPLDTDVKLVVASKTFQVADPTGKPMRDGQPSGAAANAATTPSASNGTILNRGSFTVRVPASAQAAASKVTFRVTGVEAN